MNNMLKQLSLICLLIMSASVMAAQDQQASFTVEAPSKVVVGQQFNVSYVFTNMDHKDFREPEFKDFKLLYGPSTSRSSSVQIVNGKRSSVSEYRYTFYLSADKEGTFTIPAATATVKKEKVSSNTVKVTVLPEDKNAASSAASSSSAARSGSGAASASSQSLTEENLFVRAIASKTKVYEQEAVTLSYKLYTRVDIASLNRVDFPEYKGFMTQDVEIPQDKQWDMENYNGLNYRTALIKQVVLFPQQAGSLKIEPASFDAVVRLRVQPNASSRSIFDNFFESYQDVNKTLKSKPLTIQVEALPFGKPASFHPFSGSLNLSSEISSQQVKADEAVTLRLKLTGKGNMKMLKTPDIKFPADFDVYDPKTDNQFKTTANGMSGSKTIEYLIIPRYAGTFEIPSVEVSYFDLASQSYKTLRTQPYTLSVDRADRQDALVTGNYTGGTAKQQVRVLGQDIRYLKTGPLNLQQRPVFIYAAAWFPWVYILPFVLFVVVLVIYRKQIKANADLARQRTRKANKVAVKRLRRAAVYLKQNNRAAFFDEVLKALWGYTSDKLSIPLSELSKDNMDAQLAKRQVPEDIRQDYMTILEACEFEQYAPGQAGQTMDELYAKTLQVIDKMENTIKK